jgi:hydroxyacylglutathione hydrolase
LALKAETNCTIIGPRGEAAKIPGIDRQVAEGDTFKFGSFEVRVLDTPGHTAGHITYWIPSADVAFVGDTLFAIGCGRVIEGNAQMMWQSLQKLMALPPQTSVYCGHEYTQSNAKFALAIEPENAALQKRAKEVDSLRAAGKATLPTTIGLELETNPFLRPAIPAIQQRLGMAGKPEWQIFGEIRERKNRG